DCFLAALFFRTAQRRGMKKAAVAVAHRILIIAWHILAEAGVEYYERGGDHFDRRHPERTARKLTRRLEAIGYKVTLIAPPKPLETARWNAANTARSSIRLRQMCSLGHASLHLSREAQPHTLAASERTASITYLVG